MRVRGQVAVCRTEQIDQRDMPHANRRGVQRAQQQLRWAAPPRRTLPQAAERQPRRVVVAQPGLQRHLRRRRAGSGAGSGSGMPRSASSSSSRPRPRQASTRNGSSSNASASTYSTAEACLHGTDQSGHVQSHVQIRREQRAAERGEHVHDLVRHVAGQQRARGTTPARPAPPGSRVQSASSYAVDRDRHPVRLGPRPLHARTHPAGSTLEVDHLALAGVRPAAGEPAPVADRSRMSTNRRDHHCSPIFPRLARTAIPPST